jgi:hypothetical protein
MREYKFYFWYETKNDDCDDGKVIIKSKNIEEALILFKDIKRNYKRITKIEEI